MLSQSGDHVSNASAVKTLTSARAASTPGCSTLTLETTKQFARATRSTWSSCRSSPMGSRLITITNAWAATWDRSSGAASCAPTVFTSACAKTAISLAQSRSRPRSVATTQVIESSSSSSLGSRSRNTSSAMGVRQFQSWASDTSVRTALTSMSVKRVIRSSWWESRRSRHRIQLLTKHITLLQGSSWRQTKLKDRPRSWIK